MASQDSQNETEKPDHSASSGDSITASTRKGFRYIQGMQIHRSDVGQLVLPLVREADCECKSAHENQANGPDCIQIEPAPRYELETHMTVD